MGRSHGVRRGQSGGLRPLSREKKKKYKKRINALSQKVEAYTQKILQSKAKKPTLLRKIKRHFLRIGVANMTAKTKGLQRKIDGVRIRSPIAPTRVASVSSKRTDPPRNDHDLKALLRQQTQVRARLTGVQQKFSEMKTKVKGAKKAASNTRKMVGKYVDALKVQKQIRQELGSFKQEKKMWVDLAIGQLGGKASKEAIKKHVIDNVVGAIANNVDSKLAKLKKAVAGLRSKAEAQFKKKFPLITTPSKQEINDEMMLMFKPQVRKIVELKRELEMLQENLPQIQAGVKQDLSKYYDLYMPN